MQTSPQWRHMYNKGKQFENQFFIYGPKCKNNYILDYLGALRGSSIIILGLSSFPAILSPISMYLSNKEAIWKYFFKFKPKIWKNLGGSWGPLTSNLGKQICQGSKTSSQIRHMYNNRTKEPPGLNRQHVSKWEKGQIYNLEKSALE